MNKKKIIIEICFLIAVIGATVISLGRNGGFAQSMESISHIGITGLLVSILLLMAYILLESVIIRMLMHMFDEEVSMGQCFKYSFIGYFFYCISPAGSGEQPMQLYAMHKDGIDTSKSVLSLALITITFKLALVVFGIAFYLVSPDHLLKLAEPANLLGVIGLVLSIAAIVLFVCVLCIPENVRKSAVLLIGCLEKFGIRGKKENFIRKIDGFVGQYAKAVKLCRGHGLMLAAVFGVTLVQRICFIAITASSVYAMGYTSQNPVDVTALQGVIQLATEMLPLPGGMGANEMLYLKIFGPLFGNDTMSTLIVTRGIGFYCQMIICGAAAAGFALYAKVKKKLTGGKK